MVTRCRFPLVERAGFGQVKHGSAWEEPCLRLMQSEKPNHDIAALKIIAWLRFRSKVDSRTDANAAAVVASETVPTPLEKFAGSA